MTLDVDAARLAIGAPARGGHRIGAMLDQLRRESFHVLQGVEVTDAGSVDYLVMGPTGVYAIGTHRRFDASTIDQVKRQAARLRETLGVEVTPVICPPGRQGRRPFEHEGMWIVRRDDLAGWLRAQQNEVLDFVRFPRIAEQL